MPRQISDEEYSRLLGRAQIADLVEPIYNDPQLSREAKALIKKKYPNLQIPDYDIRNEIDRRFEEEKKAREDQEAALKQKRLNDEIVSTRKRVQQDYGFTDDAMKRLEDLMIDRNIGDYEAGAMLLASKEPKASEPTHDTYRWNHDRQEGFKEIAADPEGWARNQILTAVRADEQRQRGQR